MSPAPRTLHLAGSALPVVGRARVYVCGITPYDTTHLGHAATFVWTDVLTRVLRHGGVEVDVCRNITDVDDDMLEQASRQGEDWRRLATRQTYRFEEDMRLLGVAAPTFEPQAHNYVDEVIALAAALLEAGAAYEREGTVWFRGADVPARAGLEHDEARVRAAAGGDHPDDPAKDDPFDVPVWQAARPGEPSWPSPWGDGRPGWHASCAAMALSTLGGGIDVHAGGADLAFPHHAYEGAQAEAATGVRPFARAWMHVGTVLHHGEKMAKSAGNLVFLHDLLEDWPPAAIRLLLIDRPWRADWDFHLEDLAGAADRLQRLRVATSRDRDDPAALHAALDALHDDLNVARALHVAEEAGGKPLHAVANLLGLL